MLSKDSPGAFTIVCAETYISLSCFQTSLRVFVSAFFNGMSTGQAASGVSAWKPGSCQKGCGSMSNFAVLNLSQNVK